MNMESIGEYEYSKKDLIGHGAFAVVFKGRRRKKHDFIVAIKCITKKNLAKSQNLLSKEIKILRELSDLKHENVVALLDCKETPHHVYLVMEYCNGGDLADYLQVKTTLSEDTIALFLRQIAGAMQALVAKGIVHRDLKPQNILLTHPGKSPNPPPSEIQIKIADFGFARFLQDGVMAATLCGSPMYMAPEVIMSLQYDAKADLWSVGTIAYQCLTGKAPFQAQTPQQLKQFYERNANLAPNIPPGTSLELRNLLIGLLKRNARERMDFETFFKHPFHNPHAKSSPVPVPRSRSRSSLGESPPVKAVTSSPLSANVYMSPPQTIPSARPKSVIQEPMEVGSPLKEIPKSLPKEAPVLPAKHTPPEDFVMVPDNIPSDHSVSSNSSGQRPPSSVDLNAIFSDASPDSPRHVPKTVRPSPYSRKGTEADCLTPRKSSPPHRAGSISPPIGSPTKGAEGGVVGVSSPSRPSSLPGVQSPQSSPSTEPIPVPGQAKAYEQIQRSTGSFSPGSVSPHHRLHSPASVPRVNSPQGVAIPRRTSAINVGSVSPPQVQFTVGTPPSHATGWSKRNISQSASNNNSPLRLQNTNRLSNPNVQAAQSGSPLPTILGSPTKIPGGPSFHRLGKPDDSSPTSPLQAAFGKVGMRNRTFTCPDNIQAVGYSPDDNIDPSVKNHNKQMVPVSSATQLGEGRLKREGSTGKLSEQLIRAAFGGQIPSPPTNVFGAQFHTSPSSQGMMVPYSGSNTSLHQVASSSSLRERSDSTSSRNRHVSGSDDVATGNVPPFTQSPPNMEGPIMFVPPDLVEETLMDPEHNETVSKLNFVLALVECIIELAQSRSSPLSESVIDQKPTSTFTLDHIAFISESQRRMEQLVLYVRALQLLSSSISLAKEEIKSARLQPSNTVRNILKEMNDYYHQCLTVCKHLHNKGVGQNLDSDPAAAAVTADKLIYSYAIEMCQTAALDELFGNPQECFRRYRNAQILLHSLAQQAQCETDRQLLNKYKDSVEKRLFQLHSQGYITTTYDSS